MLGSIEWAWQHWSADDPRWLTIVSLSHPLLDDTVRRPDSIPERDAAWASLVREVVDAIGDLHANERCELSELHRVAAVAEAISQRINGEAMIAFSSSSGVPPAAVAVHCVTPSKMPASTPA